MSRISRAVAIMGMLVWLLSACAPAQAPAKPTPAQLPTPTPSPQPKTGGTLQLVITFDPQGMDLHTIVAASAQDQGDLVFNRLLKFAPEAKHRIVPDLAESWEQPDATTYILRLRKGVKWQDIPPVNGREFTSADAKYSLERIATNKPEFRRNWMFLDMDRIEAPDKYTLKIVLKNISAPFFGYLADRWNVMIPKEVIDKDTNLEKLWIGTGPFVQKSFTRGVGGEYVKNPLYWEPGKPYMDGAVVTLIKDNAARIAAFRTGKVDMMRGQRTDLNALARTNPGVAMAKAPGKHDDAPIGTVLRLQNQRAPYNDVRVRQAIAYALDYEAMIQAVVDGDATRSGPLAPSMSHWGAKQPQELPKRDLEKAKRLLAEAGYANGFKTDCKGSTSRVAWVKSCEVIKDQLAPLGIQVEIIANEHSKHIAEAVRSDFNMLTMGDWFEAFDPDVLYNHYHTKGGRNYELYKNPRVDELLDLQRQTIDFEKRKQMILEVQNILLTEFPKVTLFYAWGYEFVQPWVKGWWGDHPGDDVYWDWNQNLWLDREK